MTDENTTQIENEAVKKPAKNSAGPSYVRMISDLGPALAFFIAYFIAKQIKAEQPLIFATIAFLPIAIAGFIFSWVKERKISPVGAFTFVMVGGFSLLGIFIKDDIFIKMRPTAVYTAMGSILILSVVFKRNILKTILDGAIHMPENIWRTLAIRAGIMNLILAALNEIVWRNFAENTWVVYNMWGDFSINMAFWVINIIFLAKHFTDEDGKPLLENEK